MVAERVFDRSGPRTHGAPGAFPSTDALERMLRDYVATNNADPTPFVWTKSADDILASVSRYCQRTSGSHH